MELCKVVSSYDGIFACHTRSITEKVIEAVKEAIEIAEKANVRTTISHLLSIGKTNWGKVTIALELVENARNRGVEIVQDLIPYVTGGGNYFNPELIALLPEWARNSIEKLKHPKAREKVKNQIKEGVTNRRYTREWYPLKFPLWEDMIKVIKCKNKNLEGKTIGEIANLTKKDPYDVIIDLIVEDPTSKAIWFWCSESDISEVLRHPLTMIGSDGGIIRSWEVKRYKEGYPWERIPNPRVYGTFPHVLGKYVRETKVLNLETAIRKMTSAPAQFLRLKDRGLIKEGNYADIVIFNPKKIIDKPAYTEWPQQYAEGIEYVLVNGKIAVEKAKYKEVFAGKVLRFH
jgi:N-acyl-D-amino-acid deacylase